MTDITYCESGCTRASHGERIRVTTEPPATICRTCEDQIRLWLREIPERYTLLPGFVAHGTVDRNPDAKATPNVDAPAPMRLDLIDLLDTRRGRRWQGIAVTEDRRGTLGTLHAWAQLLRDEKPLTALNKEPTVAGESDVLARHMLWIINQPWAAEMHAELRVLHRMLGDAIGIRRPRPVGMCPVEDDQGACEAPLFPAILGGVRCPRGHAWDMDELRRLGLLLGDSA